MDPSAKAVQNGFTSRLHQIPVLYCRGNHRTIGFTMGRQFKAIISNLVETWDFLNEVLLPAYNTAQGRSIYEKSLDLCTRRFPKYVEELEGIAEGAEQPFYKLFLLHLESMLGSPSDDNAAWKAKLETGCTSVHCNSDEVLLGHTEDSCPEILNNVYIVAAEVLGEDGVTVKEKFSTLTYGGHLPGYTMGWNAAGVVHCVNTLYPKSPYVAGTPRTFIARALLTATTLEEVMNILRDEGVGIADGFSLNLAFANSKSSKPEFYNIEVSPPCSEKPNESQLHLYSVQEGSLYAHCNKYLRILTPELPGISRRSSVQRHKTLEKYSSTPPSLQAIKNILSDMTDEEYPIFRNGKNPDLVVTVAVGIFDLGRKTWSIYTGPPSASEPVAVLPMTFNL